MQLAISIPFQNMKYRSFMSPLSKLNAIEISEAGWGNSEATVHYGLYCACCKQFITNSLWTILCLLQKVHNQFWWIHNFNKKLVDLQQIAPDFHYGTFCTFSMRKLWTKTTTLHLSRPTPLCVLILQNMKSWITTYSLKISSLCQM